MKLSIRSVSLVLIASLIMVFIAPTAANAQSANRVCLNKIVVKSTEPGNTSYVYAEKGNQIDISFDTITDTVTVNGKTYNINTYRLSFYRPSLGISLWIP